MTPAEKLRLEPHAIRQWLDGRIEKQLDVAVEIGDDDHRDAERANALIYSDALQSVRLVLFGSEFDYAKTKRIQKEVKK